MLINALQINMLKTDKCLLYNTKLLVLHYCNINFDLYRAWIIGFNVFIFLILYMLLVHDYLGFEPALVYFRGKLNRYEGQIWKKTKNYAV